jgi:N-methylhydantoinase A
VGPLGERWPLVPGLFADMEGAIRRQLELEGFEAGQQRRRRSLDLRYRSQAFELNLELGDEPLATVEAAFHRRHLAMYGHADETATIELVNARLSAYGVVPKPAAARHDSGGTSLDAALIERRSIRFDGAAHDCPVWERERLPADAELRGPAIVEEFGATTVVPPGWCGSVDAWGNLRFERP